MHSLTSIVAALSLLSTTLAAPAAEARFRPHRGPHHPKQTRTLADLQLPGSTLPAADGMTLKYLTLGIGTQNYTCTAAMANTDVPVQTGALTGAVANLWDLSPIVNLPDDKIAELMPQIPHIALCATGGNPNVTQMPPKLAKCGIQPTPMGNHFFRSDGVPIFALPSAGVAFSAKKLNVANAPADAFPGLDGEANGAVPWLQLGDAGGSTGGVKMVYRVNTAGGMNPATCGDIAGGDNVLKYQAVHYATQYWFYG